jgi:thiamine kinase-like enzyme
MNFESIYKNRPYLFEIKKDSFEGNEEIIEEILKKENIPFSDIEISFVSSNYNYDVYRITDKNNSYCIKYSFDTNNQSLKREFDVIKSLPNEISAIAVAYGKLFFGDIIHYSITSFENAEDIRSLGVSTIMSNLRDFLKDFQALQKCSAEVDSFNSYLATFLDTVKIKSFPEESIEAISAHTNLSIIQDSIKEIENEILYLCDPKILRRSTLCHGNLKPSNILYRNGAFKFVDFNDSYFGNQLLDLASLVIYSGLSNDNGKELIENFLCTQCKEYSEQALLEYRVCYQIMVRKVFLEILITYLKEVYVFSSSRPMKILDCIDLFSKNADDFFRIPAVVKHKEFIYKTIMEPVVGFVD